MAISNELQAKIFADFLQTQALEMFYVVNLKTEEFIKHEKYPRDAQAISLLVLRIILEGGRPVVKEFS